MQKTNYIIVSILLVFIFSCQRRGPKSYDIASGADVKAFVESEKKKNTYDIKIKEVNFKLRHISNEQMALRDLDDVSKATQASFDSILKGYEGLLFFHLEVSIDGFNEELIHYGLDQGSASALEERTAYYAFDMQKDISIVLAEKDTIPCTIYHYERNYGVSPQNSFMLGFEASHLKNAVLVYDNKYLPTGTVKFALSEQDLLTHPQIKIN